MNVVKYFEGWSNILTGLGKSNRDKRVSASIDNPSIFTREELEALQASDDMANKICGLPPKEMTREWITCQHEDQEVAEQIHMRLEELEIQSKVAEALTWGRTFGDALMILGADDGQKDLSQPLNEKNIQKFDWVYVVDRYDVNIKSWYDKLGETKYGEPQIYTVNNNSGGGGSQMLSMDFHESRVIRFSGAMTTRQRQLKNAGWNDSVLLKVYDVLRDFNSSWGGAANLLTDFSQAVFKIKGLAAMLASDKDQLVLNRLLLLDTARSIARAIPIDENEEFTRETASIAGLADLLGMFSKRLSGAAGMPVSLLMGEHPAGLAATGDASIRFFYDSIKADQEQILRPALNRIIKLIYLSKQGPTGGQEPEDWSFEFNPLWQLTEKEEADIRYVQAQTDAIYIDRGALLPEQVTKARFSGQKYSTETQIDEDTIEEYAAERKQSAENDSPEPAGIGPASSKAQEEKAV